jgi:tight adherence protein B
VLATGSGRPAHVAAHVVEMVAVGGSVSDGVQMAASDELAATRGRSPAGEALQWLSMTQQVVERAGAPSAAVHDGISAGLLAELARADDQAAALAGPRTTAGMLAALPLAGTVLGAAMGADVPGTLIGTPAGRVCLVLGIVFWLAGGLWARRLVGAAAGTAGRGP